LIAKGAKLRPFSKEILDRCYDEAVNLYAEIGAENADFKTIADSMWNFRKEQYLWWQVAEYGSDTINIASVRK
jgi:TRAP-type mannitol/chloroaromatic compound transport system substrate-binding protein